MLNVVILNGGRCTAATILVMLDSQGLHVTSVVNAYDYGKSTEAVGQFFGMLGPSDIRKVQELMPPPDDPDHAANLNIFRFRFADGMAYEHAVSHLQDFCNRAQ